jgi:predicted aminopeptidase
VGWQGALEFARRRHGIASPQYDRTVRAFAAEERRDEKARDVFRKLDALYKSGKPAREIVSERDRVAGLPVNNAQILMQRRYGRYDEFRAKFEKAGGEWNRFFDALVREKGGL